MSRNGKQKSRMQMSELQEEKISAALESVFRYFNECVGTRLKDRRTADFVFHMMDWHDDLVKLAELYAHPDKHDQKTWNQGVAGFLIHAVGHLMAAAKLNDTFCDTFNTVIPAKRPPRKRRAASIHAP